MIARLEADWPAFARVHAFTTLRHGAGHSQAPFDSFNLGNCLAPEGDDGGVVDRNRAELVERFALPSPPRWLRQVHGNAVVRFDDFVDAAQGFSPFEKGGQGGFAQRAVTQQQIPLDPPFSKGEVKLGLREEIPVSEADAAITATPDTVLAILTADCLPVLFAAEDGSEVGAAHAGWRGLAAGVLENTVAAMHAPPARLVAWLGPAAGPQAYEVGDEVRDALLVHDASAADAFAATRAGHWHVDLYALARRRLADVGVSRVHGGGLCTISDPRRFYSHRRDHRTGRMATLIWFEAT